MPFLIKLNLQFDDNLVFREFLPEAESDALTLTVMEGKYRVRVFISDRSKQIRGGAELPTDLRKNLSLHCAGLTVKVEVLSPAAEIVDALEYGQRTEQTEDFGREIFGLALNIHNGIISYFRNIEKQSWVEPIAPDPRNWQSFLDGCDTVWLD